MITALRANLAVLAAVGALFDAPAQPVALDEPRTIVFRLTDGVTLRGRITEWDREGFDGTFGRRFWYELNPEDTWRVARRAMNADNPIHWVHLGSILMSLGDQTARADAVFRRAVEMDPEMSTLIDAARADAERRAKAIAAERARRAAARLSSETPESGEWHATAWPLLNPREQESARLSVLNDADAMLEAVNVEMSAMETDFFLIFTDGDRRQAAQLAVRLDRHYRELCELLGVNPGTNLFWGKAAVFLFEKQEDFRRFETERFRQAVSPAHTAITHFSGPKVYIVGWLRPQPVIIEAALAHELVHAVMHRYVSPKRLPAWANEGLAEHFAQKVFDNSPMYDGLRPVGLQLIRSGLSALDVLNLTYADESFPGPHHAVYAMGPLFIEQMQRAGRGEPLRRWIREVKLGTDWREALMTHFNATPEQFAASVTSFYRVND